MPRRDDPRRAEFRFGIHETPPDRQFDGGLWILPCRRGRGRGGASYNPHDLMEGSGTGGGREVKEDLDVLKPDAGGAVGRT